MNFKFPKRYQWLQFFKILSLKEKVLFFLFLFIFISSGIFLSIDFYLKNTKIVPAKGGVFVEGVIGYPALINPLFAPLSEVDMALTELIFSGLLKYNLDGKLEPDLAKEYQILEDGKVFEFKLKENLFWQDGKPLTADDVVFTVETIKNPQVASPLRPAWLGVEVEKVSDQVVRFKLKESSNIFLENCTLKIIPKHIFENFPPQNLKIANNLNPVGSGPYKFAGASQDKEGKIVSIDLIENPFYYGKKPFIPAISFHFFEKPENLISAFNQGEIKAFSLSPTQTFNLPLNSRLIYFRFPRYFAVFLNSKNSEVLAEENVRKALNYGTNKDEIIQKILFGKGEKVDLPLFSEIYNLKLPENLPKFDPEKAKELLKEAGFSLDENGKMVKIEKKEPVFQFKSDLRVGSQGKEVEELQKCLAKDPEIYPQGEVTGYFGQKTKEAVIKFQEKYRQDILEPVGLKKGTGEVKEKTREKLNEICFEKIEKKIPLKFTLVTGDEEILKKTAQILKEQWEKIGFEIEIKTYDLATLEREILRKKDYDALLFGILLKFSPDPFPFWHSSQRGELGLNLANYNNRDVDKLLEEIRKTQSESERKEKLEKFQEILISDSPAIFLFNPYYVYVVSSEIQGLPKNNIFLADSSKRFLNIQDWYLKTKRAWK
jgi:ABC-type transport system substrate-binding protein